MLARLGTFLVLITCTVFVMERQLRQFCTVHEIVTRNRPEMASVNAPLAVIKKTQISKKYFVFVFASV